MMAPRYLAMAGEETPARRLASCGRAVPGVRVRVVNDQGNDVQPGEVGEIVARGPNIMQGYWNEPEETAAAFRHGWFCTVTWRRWTRNSSSSWWTAKKT